MRAGCTIILVLMAVMGSCTVVYAQGVGIADGVPDAVMKAYGMRMNGDSDDAREMLEVHLKEHPSDKWAHYELARTYFYHMAMKKAQKSIAKAIERDPDISEFHYLAGQIGTYYGMLKMKNPLKWPVVPLTFSKSIHAYERAVDCDPSWSEARLRIVEAANIPWYMGGSGKKVTSQMNALEEIDPVYAAIAQCRLIKSDEREKRITVYEALIPEHRRNPLLNRCLGLEYCVSGNYDKGLPLIMTAMETDPSHADALLLVGKAGGAGRDFDRAAAGAEQYLAMDTPVPLRAYACGQMGVICNRSEKPDEAQTWFSRAREIDPHVWSTYVPPPSDLFMPPGWRCGKN